MAIHVRNVTIDAYRGISNLKLENLNHINVLTGDNNSGKTSVMEILSYIDSPECISTWVSSSRRNSGQKTLFYNYFYNMFPIDEDNKVIQFGYMNNKGEYTDIILKAYIEETQIPEDEMLRLNGYLRTGSKRQENSVVETKCMHLGVEVNGLRVNEYALFDFQTRLSMYKPKDAGVVNIVSVSPTSHATGMLYLREILEDPELYTEMLNVLQEFDEDIISINVANVDEYSRIPEYMILSKRHNSALPLNVYGDGMKKAILMLSAVIKAKGGILLLDEFETAIHTSAMEPVFSWILRSARKLDVQLFLTSHSKEAIDKILKCCPDMQDEINVYTIYKKSTQSYIRTMNGREAIQAQDDFGLELR